MASASGPDRSSKKDRREAAREKARIMREEAQRKAKRRRWIVQGSVSVAVLAVLAIIALVVVTSIKPAGPGPKNMAGGGILLTSTTKVVSTPAMAADSTPKPAAVLKDKSVAHITTYVDYQCPYCDQFETTNNTQIGQWLDSGAATLEVHPVAILDTAGNDKYSTRAANAAACVANDKPSAFFAVNSALFENQPQEGGSGLSDSKLLSILKGAGASSSAITSCVKDGTYSSWVTAQTTTAKSTPALQNPRSGSFGTPVVLVNGKMYPGSLTDASAFLSFVSSTVSAAAGDGSGSTPTSTSTPTPTSTPAG
ncbi:thioredoxin domain-containing protein [Microbacterium sp. STN6]|uniref:thioredoxin domain-containing protein n=1 Tax=Microbacterium sp. STN6 TaxID=2995588 RepID=UPI002260AD1B|nr:thioredoxin domain-containing protein [Microbacterium sp. STN6]MCX7521206.1 thioredoxin domain-containing protein [Microbacterium sp. STN6]